MPSAIMPTAAANGTDLFHFIVARKLSKTSSARPPSPSGSSTDPSGSRPLSGAAPTGRPQRRDQLAAEQRASSPLIGQCGEPRRHRIAALGLAEIALDAP